MSDLPKNSKNRLISSRRFLQSTVILICILIIELIFMRTIGNPFSQPRSWLFLFFLPIVITGLIVQYSIFRYSTRMYHFQKNNVFHIIVNIAQFAIMVLLSIVLLKTIPAFDSFLRHSLDMEVILSSLASISYALAATLLGIVASKFFKFYKSRMILASLLNGLSFSVLTFNAILNLARIDIQLGYFVILPIGVCGQFEATSSCPQINFLVLSTLIISFLLLWTSTIFKMYNYKHDLGKKIWVLILMPLSFLLVQLITFHPSLLIGILGVENEFFVLVILSPIIFYFLLRFIPAYAFAASFWITRKLVTNADKQDAILVSGVGLFLYLITMNQTITTLSGFVHYYVPFGIIAISLVGLFTYMINLVDVKNDVM